MANRFARCLNTDYCSLGDRRLVMRLADTEPFFCPECAHALAPAPPWRTSARISPILGVAAMSVLAMASGLMVARQWPHAVSSMSPAWLASAPPSPTVPSPQAPYLRAPQAQDVATPPAPDGVTIMTGASNADAMPDPGRVFLAATMDDWLPHRAGDYILRKRRMRAPRTDPLAVAARAALEAGVPSVPAPPAPPASMPWRQAMIMAALVSPDQPLSSPLSSPLSAPLRSPGPPTAGPSPAGNAPVAAQVAAFPPPQGMSDAPRSAGGKPLIRPQTSLVPTALPAIRVAEVKKPPATLTESGPPAPLTPFVHILQQGALQQAVLQHALHENVAQSGGAPFVAQTTPSAAAEQRTQLALEDGLIRAVSPADSDIGTRLLRTLPGNVAAPGSPAPKTVPHPAAKTHLPAAAAAAPVHKVPPPSVAAKPARPASLADRKTAKPTGPASQHAVAPEAVVKAAPAPVAPAAPASSTDAAATQDEPAPRTRTVVVPAGFKMSYGPLKDVKLQDSNGIFMKARPSAPQPETGRLLVDCVIETTGVPSNCHVLHAENAAGVQDAVLAMLVSGMVHKTPKIEDGHPVRARQTWTMEFPAQSQQ